MPGPSRNFRVPLTFETLGSPEAFSDDKRGMPLTRKAFTFISTVPYSGY